MDIVSKVYSFVAFPFKRTFSANRFLTEVRLGEMTKQTGEFGPFKPFSYYCVRKNKASEKQNIHCYKYLEIFDGKNKGCLR